MLDELVEQLDLIPVLDESAVQRIKQYITVKFPEASSTEQARTLANTVHRVMDKELGEFNPTLRSSIKVQALETALIKDSFSLNAGDLFQACAKAIPRLSAKSLPGKPFDDQVDAQVDTRIDTQVDAQITAWLNRQRCSPNLQPTQPVEAAWVREWLGLVIENRLVPGDHRDREDRLVTEDFPDTGSSTTTSTPKGIPVQKHSPLLASIPLPGSRPLTRGIIITGAVLLFLAPLIGAFSLNDIISVMGSGVNSQAQQFGNQMYPEGNLSGNQLPSYLRYQEVNVSELKEYLRGKGSLLADEPYFTTIVESCREFDVNPLVLFAIAGHEQGFVPRAGHNSSRIINNPFNVFHSWKEYNTTLRDSSRIAARTVVHASEGLPKGTNPFQWINKRYAEDVNWWKGVNSIYTDLEKL